MKRSSTQAFDDSQQAANESETEPDLTPEFPLAQPGSGKGKGKKGKMTSILHAEEGRPLPMPDLPGDNLVRCSGVCAQWYPMHFNHRDNWMCERCVYYVVQGEQLKKLPQTDPMVANAITWHMRASTMMFERLIESVVVPKADGPPPPQPVAAATTAQPETTNETQARGC